MDNLRPVIVVTNENVLYTDTDIGGDSDGDINDTDDEHITDMNENECHKAAEKHDPPERNTVPRGSPTTTSTEQPG